MTIEDVFGFADLRRRSHFRGFVSGAASLVTGATAGNGGDLRNRVTPRFEFDPVAVVDQAIEYRVRQSWFAEIGVPFVH